MVGVQGLAGTGKTTALGVLRTFAEDYGFEVRGVAATGGASNALAAVGITSNTLAGFMFEDDTVPRRPRLYAGETTMWTEISSFFRLQNSKWS
jgi:hypothetical protein